MKKKAYNGWKEYHKKKRQEIAKRKARFRRRIKDKKALEANPFLRKINYAKYSISYHIRKIVAHSTEVPYQKRWSTRTGNLTKKQAYLKRHLEGKFLPEMCWENWGSKPGCWQISFIVPVECATNAYELTKYTRCVNLMPTWKTYKKRAK